MPHSDPDHNPDHNPDHDPDSDARPTSNHTDYSLDLSALDDLSHLDSDDDDNTGDFSGPHGLPQQQQQRIERIRSSEIDGPSDFTVNMDRWMRGGGDTPLRRRLGEGRGDVVTGDGEERVGKKEVDEAEGKTSEDPLELEGEARGSADGESGGVESSGEGRADAVAGAGEQSVTFVPGEGEGEGASEHGNEATRHGDGEDGHDNEDREESSIWDPYNHSSSLHFPKRNGFLQPTVEDYNSEMTPGRPASTTALGTQSPFKMPFDMPDRRANSTPRGRPTHGRSSPGIPSSPTLSPVRTPMPPPPTSAADAKKDSNEDELLALRRQLSALTTTNSTLHHDLTTLRTTTTHLESALSASKQREQDITQHFESALASRRDSEQALHLALDSAQRAQQDALRLADARAKDVSEMRDTEDEALSQERCNAAQAREAEARATAALDTLREQVEAGRGRVESAEKERDEARRAEQSALEELRLLREQMAEHATELSRETHRLRAELDEAQRGEESARAEAERLTLLNSQLEQQLQQQQQQQNQAQTQHNPAREDEDAAQRAESLRQTLEKQLHAATRQIEELRREKQTERDARRRAEDDVAQLQDEIEMLQGISRIEDDDDDDDADEGSSGSDARAKGNATALQDKETESQKEKAKGLQTLRVAHASLLAEAASWRTKANAYAAPPSPPPPPQQEQQQHQNQNQTLVKKLEAQLATARSQLAEQTAEHRRTITLIEEGMASLRAERQRLVGECAALQEQLTTSRQELGNAREALEITATDLATARQETQDLRAVDQAFDERVAGLLKQREEAWRVKLRVARKECADAEERAVRLGREREVMGKALMRMWGRDECGFDADAAAAAGKGEDMEKQVQRYLYRFAKA